MEGRFPDGDQMPTSKRKVRRIREELAALLPSDANTRLVTLDPRDARSLTQIAASRQNDDEVRRLAVVLIGRLRIRGAVPALIKNLSEDKPNLALSSASALGSIRSRDATTPLIRALEECPYWRNREAIAMVFKELKDQRAFGALKRTLLNSNEVSAVRFQAAEALAGWKSQRTVSAFLKTTRDSSAEVRWISAYTLGFSGDERALLALLDLIDDRESPQGMTSVGEQARESLATFHRVGVLRAKSGKQKRDREEGVGNRNPNI